MYNFPLKLYEYLKFLRGKKKQRFKKVVDIAELTENTIELRITTHSALRAHILPQENGLCHTGNPGCPRHTFLQASGGGGCAVTKGISLNKTP